MQTVNQKVPGSNPTCCKLFPLPLLPMGDQPLTERAWMQNEALLPLPLFLLFLQQWTLTLHTSPHLAWCLFFLTVCNTACVFVTPPSVKMKTWHGSPLQRLLLNIQRRGASSSVPPRHAWSWFANVVALSTVCLEYSVLEWNSWRNVDPKAMTLK